MTELTDFLTARGYLRVPLTRSGVGHFHTAGTQRTLGGGLGGHRGGLHGRRDVGCRGTRPAVGVDRPRGGRSERRARSVPGLRCGLSTRFAQSATGRPYRHRFRASERPLRAQGSADVDVFDAHAAIIDYASQSLFLMAVATEPSAG